VRATGTAGERHWVFVACGGAKEAADTQQRSPAHAPGAAARAFKLANPPTAGTWGGSGSKWEIVVESEVWLKQP